MNLVQHAFPLHLATLTPTRGAPALIVGCVVMVYWGRVLQMVRRAKRRAGHAANFIPPERLGRLLRWVWAPVVTCWVALPLLAAGGVRHPWLLRALFDVPALAWAAAATSLLALLATMVCWHRMGKSWRMGIDPTERTALVVSGPYAWVRHPIYSLSSLLMLATMLAVPSPAMWAAGITHLLLLQWESRREEAHLRRVHGEEYARYAANTGRFFPRALRGFSSRG